MGEPATGGPSVGQVVDPTDLDRVRQLLGREPRGLFTIAVRTADGWPVVIENAPLLDDGTPMPTMYWLVDPELNRRIGTIESTGGVRAAEADVDQADLRSAHDRYSRMRDALVPDDWVGPRPSGGVGGTRRGVKCLHAHYAWFLAGGEDPVGAWVQRRLDGTSTGDHRTDALTDDPPEAVRADGGGSTVDGDRADGGPS